ncbi:MAG: Pyruvate formate-lyase-activating enzyme [Bacteroidetes bacterium ADurb.Bin217]|nr:MAG: Pyruvate formate-lyase-activating enzyme [Bacteroidetes bacterium ADurb.Bin217]
METIRVHSIESFGTHDGPGIRMVVFLQGCNLRCVYCHNADTIPLQGGTDMTSDEIVSQAIRLKPYFGTQGGVTFSGGEPLVQAKQLIPVIEQLHVHNFHVAIDTNGTIQNSCTKEILQHHADLVLFDIKGIDTEHFKSITTHTLFEAHIESIRIREQACKPYWIRYVVVPGYTDAPHYIEALCNFVRPLTYLKKLQLLPYHSHGIHKWELMNMKYSLHDIEAPCESYMQTLYGIFSKFCKVEVG